MAWASALTEVLEVVIFMLVCATNTRDGAPRKPNPPEFGSDPWNSLYRFENGDVTNIPDAPAKGA